MSEWFSAWVVVRLTEVSADALVLPIISMRLQLYRGGRLALTRLFEVGAGILCVARGDMNRHGPV